MILTSQERDDQHAGWVIQEVVSGGGGELTGFRDDRCWVGHRGGSQWGMG